MSPYHSHPTTKSSYSERASKSSHPLSSYLLRLMTLKESNLCLSADVSNANELLYLADTIGPSIVILKTHYDLISNWDFLPTTGTGHQLARLARRHGFLIFEDRKFGDIGNTVQLQYVAGTAKIIEWAHIVNVNMVPGKKSVDALTEAAAKWRERKKYEVKTDITIGTPRPESVDEEGEPPEVTFNLGGIEGRDKENENVRMRDDEEGEEDSMATPMPFEDRNSLEAYKAASAGRKSSIVSITTVSQHFEPANSPRVVIDFGGEACEGIEEAPLERGLLILAQMSSEGNFMTKEYTDACVESAREHKDFVMGFIAQQTLNTALEDDFISMTPGCQLPPEGEDQDAQVHGDGKGQQYNTPQKLINGMGCDIVIVGRGIYKAADPVWEAQRYRQKAWEAFKERVRS